MAWEQLSLLPEPDALEEPTMAEVALRALKKYLVDGGPRGPSPLAVPCCHDCGEPLSRCGDCGAPVCFGCRMGERLPGCALPRCDACMDFYDDGASPEGLDALLSVPAFTAWAGKVR
jgi:hypothetical protein